MQDNELKNGQTVPPQDEAAQQAPADAPELPDLDLSAELAKAQAKAAENRIHAAGRRQYGKGA